MTPVPVTAERLDDFLPFLEWHLEQFAANGQFRPDDFVTQIRQKDRQLWIVWDKEVKAAMLTSVMADRLDTVLVTHCAGKDFKDWLHMWPVIEGWAREFGAKRIEVIARPGWERVLRPFGMKKTHVVLEMRL